MSRSHRSRPSSTPAAPRWPAVFLALALLCVAVRGRAVGEVSVLDFPHNGEGSRDLVAGLAVDLDQISARLARIRVRCPARRPLKAVDGQRLINRRDWASGVLRLPCEPWNAYGADTLETWMDTVGWLMSQPPNRPLTSGFLREIHRRVMRGHPFRPYVRRRIQAAHREGRLSLTEMEDWEARLGRGEPVPFGGAAPSSLPGVFRSHPLEAFVHNGESVRPDGRRYLIPDEIERLRANPFFVVDETSLIQKAPGIIMGTVRYTPPVRVAREVRSVVDEARRRLGGSPGRAEVLRVIVGLSRDLMSVHPFIDGNGRAIRLLADFLLESRGLPPPLYPNELDMMMTADEVFHYTLRAMVAYVEAMERAVYLRLRASPGRQGQCP